ncbi:hypothetical protein ABPG75_011919 [Micractinium tetrahymenae]
MRASAYLASSPAQLVPDCEPLWCLSVETPAAIPSLAATTPTSCHVEQHSTHAAAGAAAPAAAGAAGGGGAPPGPPAADPATLQLCIQSFVRCVAHSPLLQSALLSLEVSATHPPAAEDAALPGAAATASLEWTLVQLLALHVKAGCVRASESSVLAALWVLESTHSSDRSLATVCLDSYLRLLAMFSEELVVRITANWPASFRKLRSLLVEAQGELLRRLDWRVRICFETEAARCRAWLFAGGCLPGGSCGIGAGVAAEQWAASIRGVCADVRKQAAVFRHAQEQCCQPRLPTPAPEEEPRPAKRARGRPL